MSSLNKREEKEAQKSQNKEKKQAIKTPAESILPILINQTSTSMNGDDLVTPVAATASEQKWITLNDLISQQDLADIRDCSVIKSKETGFSEGIREAFAPLEQEIAGKKNSSDKYFRSYENLSQHRIMISDKKRTLAYQQAIMSNSDRFKDKIVLDIGAGTGILSIFAARAGARHVYAIERSETCHLARQVIEENCLSDKITVIQVEVEKLTVEDLEGQMVDIIISEWMGFSLLYESMLDSVIHAIDRLLKEDGLMFPDRARIYIAGVDDEKYKTKNDQLWTNNDYGVSMHCMKKQLNKFAYIDTVFPYQIVTTPSKVLDIDLLKCSVEDLEFASEYNVLTYRKEDIGQQHSENYTMNALIVWFDVDFPAGIIQSEISHSSETLAFEQPREVLTLSTSPYEEVTHWKQQLLYFQCEQSSVSLCEEMEVRGSFALRKNPKDLRDIQIKLSVKVDNAGFDELFYYIFT